jgi:uncharacterized SAM-binding protein YcdF (DUF218 family)
MSSTVLITQANKYRSRARWIALAIVLAIVLASVVAFRGLGRWLVVEDPLRPAGAIVVLSGALPFRVVAAAEIYNAHMAPQIWLTRPIHPSEMETLGIAYKGEEHYNREVLIREGIPDAAIHDLAPPIIDTEQEVRAIVATMRRTGVTRVIVVTSPPHTRRVHTLWHKFASRDLELIVRATYAQEYDAGHWWRTTRDSLAVTREVLGLLNAWAGLPVRPAAD